MPAPNPPYAQNAPLDSWVAAANGKRVAVIGDVMLDHFVYSTATRLSPEAPVPILKKDRTLTVPGGAGNVVVNLAALGITPRLVAMVGQDDAGETVRQILLDRIGAEGIATLIHADDRETITKTRFIAGGQHILRVDEETTKPAVEGLERKIIAAIDAALAGVNAVILSDYGKGLLTPTILRHALTSAQKQKIPVLVDPKSKDFSVYKGADIITPNRKELAEASGMPTESDTEIVAAGHHILRQAGIKTVIATRSEKGMSVIGAEDVLHLPTEARDVFDVAGAGDTVIATVAAMLAGGAPVKIAATIANIAAGIVVAKAGTATASTEEILNALRYRRDDGMPYHAHVHSAPVLSLEAAVDQVVRWKAQGLKVGFTNGCFDILHAGHVEYLKQARSRCDRLVVGLNTDSSVRRLKGPQRPVNDEASRAVVLGGLGCVDAVILFGEDPAEGDSPMALLRALHPDIMIKGQDYTLDRVVGADYVMSYGGTVWLAPLVAGKSTTATIKKLSETG